MQISPQRSCIATDIVASSGFTCTGCKLYVGVAAAARSCRWAAMSTSFTGLRHDLGFR